jgi:hypothetical protein
MEHFLARMSYRKPHSLFERAHLLAPCYEQNKEYTGYVGCFLQWRRASCIAVTSPSLYFATIRALGRVARLKIGQSNFYMVLQISLSAYRFIIKLSVGQLCIIHLSKRIPRCKL